MARRLVADEEGTVFCFPMGKKLTAFGAAELIHDRLNVEAQVVKHRDPDTGIWGLAIALNAPARDIFEDESSQALSLCHQVMGRK
ncbi:MAG: hypothetical protein JXR97_11255 [Planctomycetes bacterium]|nr:hypothetical protein [Planctomycetota bacterium]